MKKKIVEFVYACLTCQKLKIEHQKLLGLMQPLIILDFMISLPKTTKGCDYI